MNKRQQRMERICNVVREYLASRAASALLADEVRSNPSFGREYRWSSRDADRAFENLESTYVIRVFAEFEAGLRDIWRSYYGKKRRTPMKSLLHLMARQFVPQDYVDEAQEARVYRNSIVHEGSDEEVVVLTLRDVTRRLCRYFAFQPMNW